MPCSSKCFSLLQCCQGMLHSRDALDATAHTILHECQRFTDSRHPHPARPGWCSEVQHQACTSVDRKRSKLASTPTAKHASSTSSVESLNRRDGLTWAG